MYLKCILKSKRFFYNLFKQSQVFTTIQTDSSVLKIIQSETERQRKSLALIPSENFTSVSVLQALGSIMQNKYSEGYPNARYYGGNEFIDASEQLCQKRALIAYGLDSKEWGVNVQPHSGSPANFSVYTALMKPKDRLMGLDLPHGGHLSHGFQTSTKKISAVSMYFESFSYRLNESTGIINYDEMESIAKRYNPKVLIGGASAYSRHWDTARMRRLSDLIGSNFVFDMAHISGLVAAGVHPSPFKDADIVTTTTHKSLRGPRGAMIFYRKGLKKITKKGKNIMFDYESKINQAVFPGHQGGPHNHTITALAVSLGHACKPEFKLYQRQVVNNMKTLAKVLTDLGYILVSGGTDNHLCLVDLHKNHIGGAQCEKVLEQCQIALNKNTVPGDISALVPGGIRLGTPALTTRGLVDSDMEQVANFIHRGIQISKNIKKKSTSTKLKDFINSLNSHNWVEINQLKNEVKNWMITFPLPTL